MKASDYIVDFLIKKNITDVFGYPGGMVTHLMDSLGKRQNSIKSHITYNEQGAAMAACGYAQATGRPGIAYATSGPGATNLITGICNAFMDSIPVLFITGQVNSFEQKGDLLIRQRGFQETDIVSMVDCCTKYSIRVNDALELRYQLEKAFFVMLDGRKGPVLLDIAMDVFRAEIDVDSLKPYDTNPKNNTVLPSMKDIQKMIMEAKRPVILIGNGFNRDVEMIEEINGLDVPIVTSMIAVDLKGICKNCYGFIGAYGDRCANFIIAKSDLVIAIGSRMDVRQVGAVRGDFAPQAKLIRFDIDKDELEYKVHEDEVSICIDSYVASVCVIDILKKCVNDYRTWISACDTIKEKLSGIDATLPNAFVERISDLIPDNTIITTDVGQNQVWVAQSFKIKRNQRILFSGGHGAMGYSLPAAIGALFGSNKTVYSFNGDGGIQMNIQEFQAISENRLPIKIFIFNNFALGMIRHFQEMYFSGRYYQTIPSYGFGSPDFEKLAEAYDMGYSRVSTIDEIDSLSEVLENAFPEVIEIILEDKTYVFPKLEYGKPIQDQTPLIDRDLYDELMSI